MTDALYLNRQLATLLGWTNITETGNALLGTPPEGEPQCRGQARVPDWVGDDGEAQRLSVKHGLCVSHWPRHSPPDVMVGYRKGPDDGANWIEEYGDDPFAAARRAIVRAVIAQLEAHQ